MSKFDGRECCKICSTGKACGDSCISREKNCNKGVGCACNADEVDAVLSLGCTVDPQRGREVRCNAMVAPTGATLEVTEWRFAGGGFEVVEASAANPWAGTAVRSGEVTVTALVNGRTKTVTTAFNVRPREWRWGADRWHLTEEAGPFLFDSIPEHGGMLGWNCAAHYCSLSGADPWILPYLDDSPNAGYTVERVTSGPNAGIWYVTGVSFRIDRLSNYNAKARADARRLVLFGESADRCRNAGHFLDRPVEVNFYEFNQLCGGYDMQAFVRAILDHEGYGGSGSGHQAQAEQAAGFSFNDPHLLMESVVRDSETEVRRAVRDRYRDAQERIAHASGDPEPSGNWNLGFYGWRPDTRQFVFTVSAFRLGGAP